MILWAYLIVLAENLFWIREKRTLIFAYELCDTCFKIGYKSFTFDDYF